MVSELSKITANLRPVSGHKASSLIESPTVKYVSSPLTLSTAGTAEYTFS